MAHDARAANVAQRYIAILNAIQKLQGPGFAKMLDTASTEQMDDHAEAVEFLETELVRMGVLRT